MTESDGDSATVVSPRVPRASIRWTHDATTINDGSGRETVLRHGTDVETMALRRTPTEHGGTLWTLDLMQAGTSVARFHAPPWDFDREHGPSQAAEMSGLPLVQRPVKLTDPPAAILPGAPTRLDMVVTMSPLVAGLVSLVVIFVPALREHPAVGLVLASMCLPFLIQARRPHSVPGATIFKARPSGPVARGFVADAAIRRTGRLLHVHDGFRTFVLPDSSDVCGPRELRPARMVQGPADLLVARAGDGHVLATFTRREWCGDGSEPDLAAALGVAWNPEPVEAGTGGARATSHSFRDRSNVLMVLSTFPAMTALAGGSGSSAAGVAALVVGCLTFALSLPGELVSIALRFYRRKPVAISRPKAGRPHE